MYCKYISAGLFKLPALMTTHQCRVFSLSWCAWVQGNARKTIFTDVSHLFFQADKKNPFNRLWIIAKEPPNLTSLAKINFFRDHLRGGADDDNYCKQRRPLPSQIWMKEGTLPRAVAADGGEEPPARGGDRRRCRRVGVVWIFSLFAEMIFAGEWIYRLWRWRCRLQKWFSHAFAYRRSFLPSRKNYFWPPGKRFF